MIVQTTMKLEPLKGRLWKLSEDMEYHWNGEVYLIEAGFIFDGASIPKWARPLIPKNGIKLYAACLHDYFYRNNMIDRKEADMAFLRILQEMGEPEWSAQLMYGTLRLLGWYSWSH